ncbi:MAG TPA: YicC family protein [Bacillota bacterium]|nr:YicC family protein [Bacillota bacterium]HPZ21656.1 YicC family protein [Bacillota bacterium]HQD19494.1 YicC family protein [Bacillota bacterium]
MISSMTGFGRQRFEVQGTLLIAEVKSLNHRNLDIHCRLPEAFSALEIPLRNLVKKYISRGRVDIRIFIEQGHMGTIQLNEPVYKSYLEILTAISPAGTTFDPVALLTLPNIISSVTSEPEEDSFWPPIEKALAQLRADRQREGALLWQDILEKINSINVLVTELESLASLQQQEVGARFRQRLEALGDVDDSRILAEIALLADKSDINEELVRLKAHLAAFEKCGSLQEPVGRRLEFIGQEMLREINTVGAKSAIYPVSEIALEIKAQLEKIREQLQNIE